jgi:CRISPR-associated endoribonuclease Cas6
LVVVGKAQDFLPYFIVTFEELGRQGIGIKRGRYRLVRLEAMVADGSWEEVFESQERMVRPPERLLSIGTLPERKESGGRATIRFLTPVLLKEGGRWVKPEFGPLMKRLRDRVNALSYFYCGESMDMDFREFGKRADRIQTANHGLEWVVEKRFSRSRNLNHLLKGFLGEVEFRGDLEPFAPWLRLGGFLHVGKATAFGQGWYRVM